MNRLWLLMDHLRSEVALLIRSKMGDAEGEFSDDWSMPREKL